ncbi:hypothetical protein NMQ03_08830 [Arthrobacter sp. DNA4]|uniref:hypothetical protein n=1 Tax=Arthrobacter sp. DNA4 TaxID=2963432 RepID=UPI0020CB977D|nr:hypothetical protein [Arthrobacter sp. DNA4]UTT71160.1 hypothetical protein NMQ03_08830 [Arthrobacter sp. DNA4]
MVYALDTTESEEEVQAGLWLMRKAGERIEALLEEPGLRDPEQGSRMAAVDKLTPYQPMSNQLSIFDMVAVDNLRASVKYIEKANDVPMTALYSMIRSAVEATSYGLWLLLAGKVDKQAFLSLRISYENNEDLANLGKVFAPEHESGDAVRKRLRELQQAIPAYRNRDLSARATTTDVISNADKAVPKRDGFSGLQVWKSCSGLAHANSAVIPHILERKFAGDVENGKMFRLTSRMTMLGAFLIAGVENVETLRALHQHATSAPAWAKKG